MDNQSRQIVLLRTAETIDQEAAAWLVKLDAGRLSKKDRGVLRNWLSEDPVHAIALKALASIWSDMDVMLNDFDSVEDIRPFSIAAWLGGLVSIRVAGSVLGSVAVVALVWGFVFSGAVFKAKPEAAFYTTGIGVQRLESFSDGSSVHLNTDSMIEIDFSGTIRIVRLLRGEALFDVAHDPDRPFVVYVGDRKIQAIGTEFVVRLTSENILLTVTDGRVELSKRSKSTNLVGDSKVPQVDKQEVILVSKGEVIEVDDHRVDLPVPKVVKAAEIERRLSWVGGKLVFKNERLDRVIAEVGRYVPAQIVIEDQELRDVLISGRFQLGDTEALLEAIEVSLDIQAIQGDDHVIRLAR